MGREAGGPTTAALHLVDGVALLRPDEQVFTAMLDGWRMQQLARNLAFTTIEKRLVTVRAFTGHADAFPWARRSQMLDEWLGDLRSVRGLRRSTIRNYSSTVAAFCAYLTDPAYQWVEQCERRFGSHPVQVVHEWNTAVHAQETEGDPARRAFTLDELQALFDYADEQVARAGRPVARAG